MPTRAYDGHERSASAALPVARPQTVPPRRSTRGVPGGPGLRYRRDRRQKPRGGDFRSLPARSTMRRLGADPSRSHLRTMMQITETAVMEALSHVQEPELGGDLVTRNMVRDLRIDGSAVAFQIELT